jgi:hypothetical protein
MAHRPRAALGIVVAVATLGAAGCGSSSSQTTTSNASTPAASAKSTTTKAQFVAQAEAICRRLSAEEKPLKASQESLKGASAASAQQTFVSLAGKVVKLSRTAEGQLRAIPPPPGEAAAIDQLLAVYREEATDVSNIAYFLTHQENSAGEAAAQALKRSVTGIVATARSYGMKDCIESE